MSQRPDLRSLAELLESGQLGRLRQEADRRRSLAEEIRGRLPAEEAAHLVGAALAADGALVLLMDSPGWAARVRYMTAGLPYERVRVRVLPEGGG